MVKNAVRMYRLKYGGVVIARISMTMILLLASLLPVMITCEHVLANEAIPFTEQAVSSISLYK